MVQMFRRRGLADTLGLGQVRLKAPLASELEYPDERLERVWVSHARWLDPVRVVLWLEGVRDRTQAEARQGCYVDVDPTRLVDELTDAIDACFGARVIDADTGAMLGEIAAIRDNGAQPLFEMRRVGPGAADPVLIPAVPELVPELHTGGEDRWVRVRVLPGLLEAND